MDILDVITDYFGVGGLFNPELMEHDKVSNMVEMARAEITSLREQLEIAKKDGWISVQDRLPEEHLLAGGNWTYSEKVIVFNSDGVNIQRFVNGDCFGNPTHWQPLPDPPKE